MARHTPEFELVFVNLAELSDEALSKGGAFGHVMRVVRRRKESRKPFEAVLGEVVGRLDDVARRQRPRWRDLLAYLTQLVYHERIEGEREDLADLIEKTVGVPEDRLEVNMAKRTIALAIEEEGRLKEAVSSRQVTLACQLSIRFGKLDEEILKTIEATRDVARLDEWLDRVVTAKSLAKVGIALFAP